MHKKQKDYILTSSAYLMSNGFLSMRAFLIKSIALIAVKEARK